MSNPKVNHEHDKIFRKILDYKKEAVHFINQTLKLQNKIKENEIEKYNSSFVTDRLKNEESDIIYKLKAKNIFFLIEHQTKIDYTMPLRILEYETEMIKSAIDRKKIGQKGYKLPMVIAIVLYTGRKKWNAKTYIREVQERIEGYEEVEFAKYNIVDVNEYREEELMKEETFLSKAMLIEKTRYSGKLRKCLEEIIKEMREKEEIYTKEQRKLLMIIIDLILRTKMKEEEAERMIKELKGEDRDMLAVIEMLEEENKKLLAKGEKRGIEKGIEKRTREIAKRMLEKNIPIRTIVEITGLTEETIRKMK